mmetsp:Transcript_18655/g.36492  ORF Transcript_18655/g.36492 Transcript_18655/m.36492 type:complete len:221 (+) Transcript_18655:28-690(+)
MQYFCTDFQHPHLGRLGSVGNRVSCEAAVVTRLTSRCPLWRPSGLDRGVRVDAVPVAGLHVLCPVQPQLESGSARGYQVQLLRICFDLEEERPLLLAQLLGDFWGAQRGGRYHLCRVLQLLRVVSPLNRAIRVQGEVLGVFALTTFSELEQGACDGAETLIFRAVLRVGMEGVGGATDTPGKAGRTPLRSDHRHRLVRALLGTHQYLSAPLFLLRIGPRN